LGQARDWLAFVQALRSFHWHLAKSKQPCLWC
jgi:hypothetical protein